jgi:hypothetical protein
MILTAAREAKATADGGNAMQGTLGRIVLGFLAAAISVLIVHQGIIYLLGAYGMTRSVPWSMRPLGYGIVPQIPIIANNLFWGGLWGVVFALAYDRLPASWSWLKGVIFGILVVIFSNWIFLPLIRQYMFTWPPQPLFAGFNGSNPMVLLPSFLILAGWGLGLGIIYGLIARGRTDAA